MVDKRQSGVLADYVTGLRREHVPADVAERATLHLLDTVGVMFAAADLPLVRSVRSRLREVDQADQAVVIGEPHGLSSVNAALVNGLMAHALDYDDTHLGSVVHPSCVLVPAALAMGQATDCAGADLVTALVAGYEVIARLGLAAGQGVFSRRGYHPTALLGPLGAAVVAGKLLGLKATELAHALGIAASQAGGLQQFSDGTEPGSEIKAVHPGWAAHAGIYAAILASAGATAPSGVLDGRYSLYRTHLGDAEVQLQEVTGTLGTEWETRRLCPKEYPCCAGNQVYMDAALQLKKIHSIRPEDIAEIHCYVDDLTATLECEPLEVKRHPPLPYSSKFSLPFCVAVAFCRDGAGVEEFSERTIRDPEIISLAERVTYEIDTQWVTHYSGWVSIRTVDHRDLEVRIPYTKGSQENPFSPADYAEKFRRAVAPHLTEEAADRLHHTIANIESAESLKPLWPQLAAPGNAGE